MQSTSDRTLTIRIAVGRIDCFFNEIKQEQLGFTKGKASAELLKFMMYSLASWRRSSSL